MTELTFEKLLENCKILSDGIWIYNNGDEVNFNSQLFIISNSEQEIDSNFFRDIYSKNYKRLIEFGDLKKIVNNEIDKNKVELMLTEYFENDNNSELFVRRCVKDKDWYIDKCFRENNEELLYSGKLIQKMNLNSEQMKLCKDLVNNILTDNYMTILYALEGAGTLGGLQRMYKLIDEKGQLITDGDLAAYAYQYFQGDD